jgi:transcriptional regulator with XRE-family HTH domain
MGLRERVEPGDEDFYAALARQVTDQRAARNLSQRELAELCGTTQSAIARFEAGTHPPRLDTLLRMAAALDCALDVTLRPRTRPRTLAREADPS